jgi:hypothetical protein
MSHISYKSNILNTWLTWDLTTQHLKPNTKIHNIKLLYIDKFLKPKSYSWCGGFDYSKTEKFKASQFSIAQMETGFLYSI